MRRLLYTDSVSWPASAGLFLLRLVVGVAFVYHGWPKIQNPMGWMGEDSATPGGFQALAAVAEFGGGFALILGILTRPASLAIATTMIGAMVLVHIPRGNPFIGKPGQASYELVAVYLVTTALLLLSGPGRISLDAALFGTAQQPHPQPEPQQPPSYWQMMYGSQNILRDRVIQDVTERLEARGNGARNQIADNTVFDPLATASAIAIDRRDYGFAIDLFQQCFALARQFEENNHCEMHKGAMMFNVAVAYLRANDFAAAMHYFELAQIETQQTTGDMGWGIYDSDLFQQNFWQILDLYEQQNPLPLYNTFWGVPFGSAAARHDWTHLTDHSKLLYIMLNAERISYRRLGEQPHMAVSESFGLSYWNLIADLTRLLETEIRNRGIGGGGLQAQVLYNILHSPIAGFHGIVQGAGSLNAHHPVNSPATFDAHFPAIRGIITNPAETRERRIAAAAYIAGVARNQVQHQVETTMIIFHDRAAAIFTAEVLLCLCRIDAWVP